MLTLLELSLFGTVLILVCVFLRALTLHRLPKETFVALWWVAAVRPLVPLALPARCSVYTLLESLFASSQAALPAPQPGALPPVMALPTQPVELAPEPVPAPEPIPLWVIVWLTAAALLALWFLAVYLRWRLIFREAIPMGSRNLPPQVQLGVLDRIGAPLTYGIFRPVILLPKVMDCAGQEALDCVLAHEAVHIRRKDGLLKLVLAAALCVHWFNPAVWLLYVLANRDMELRCDEAALRRLGEDSRERYALTLIRMAELRNRSMPFCSSFSENGMEERIKAIMSIKKKSIPTCVLALALVLGVTTAFATSAKPQAAERLTRDQVMTTDVAAVSALTDSVRYDGGNIYFTIPEGEGRWNIWISGRLETGDGSGMSVHYLEEESEKGEWVPRMTYSFEVGDAAFDELTLEASYGSASYSYPLTALLPEGGEPLAQPELPAGKAGIPEGAEMIWPVDSTKITNSFGDRTRPGGVGVVTHDGVDIGGLEAGAPIYAAAAGVVKDAGFSASQGNYLRLDHGNGLETFYAHCQSVEVKVGEAVALGQTVATVGSTGQATGPHLHFEISLNGVLQNPETYLQAAQSAPETNPEPPAQPAPETNPESPAQPAPGSVPQQQEAPKTAERQPQDMGAAEPQGQLALSPEAQRARERSAQEMQKALEATKKELVNGDYPQNGRGETYGNTFGYDLTGHELDLLAALGTEGQSGYVLMSEFIGPYTSTPEEAIAYTNWKEETHYTGHTIPLYDKEHNVIGLFQIGDGGPGSISYEEFLEAKANGWPNALGSTPVEREPRFKSIEEAMEAAENGWSGTSH